MKLSKSFTVTCDMRSAFDAARTYFPTLDYREKTVISPNLLVLERGSGFRSAFSTKIERYKTTLKVSLTPKGEDVLALCEYDVKTPGAIPSVSDKATLESEVEKFKCHIESMDAQEKPEFEVSLSAGSRRCETCGAPLKSDATFCLTCGRTVTPKPILIKVKGREEEVLTRGIEVKFEPNRVKTGVENLDALLCGGIPERYAVILTSPSCDERDLLISRFIQTGLEHEEITFYVSSDFGKVLELVPKYPSLLYVWVCNPQAELMVSVGYPNVFKIGSTDDTSRLNISILSAIEKFSGEMPKPRRMILTTTSDVLLNSHAQATRKWLIDLIPKLKVYGFTLLATLNSSMHPKEDTHAIIDIFDGQIDLSERKEHGNLKVYGRVKKMYNQRYIPKELPIEFN